MAVHPLSRHVWATEMGRDYLGDNLPPDEINIIMQGGNYGWPYCYGKRVHDEKFDPSGSHRDSARTPSRPLSTSRRTPPPWGWLSSLEWPQEFRYNLLVAYHGSWNRTEPTGYKVVRYKLDAAGNPIDARSSSPAG